MKKYQFTSNLILHTVIILIVGFFAVGAFAQDYGIPWELMVEENLASEEFETSEDVEASEDVYAPEDFSAPTVVKTQSGALNKFKSVTSSDIILTTSSTTNENIPAMTLKVTLKERGRMIITFSAYAFASGTALMMVTATVNGQNASPGEVQFTGADSTWAKSRSFTWVSKLYDAGTHKVRMKWRSVDGSIVAVHKRSLVVMYNR